MESRRIQLNEDRHVVVIALGPAGTATPAPPFVALVPAFDPAERRVVETAANDLIDGGCVEFCCVGPESEMLHDALDDLIERKGTLEVVTTWHVDVADACDYFLFGASAGRAALLALVSAHPELVSALQERGRRQQ